MSSGPTAEEPLVPLDGAGDSRTGTRPGRRRTLVVVLPLLAGLAVAAGVGGRLLLSPDDGAAAADGPTTCWDGRLAIDVPCPEPTGTAGLAWVFPTFDRVRLDCVDELELHPEYTRPAMWTCEQAVGGRPVQVTYSEVTGTEDALRFLDRLHGPDARRTERSAYAWRATQTPSGSWVTSLLLRDLPFAVTVTATQRSDAARALARRVEVRPPAERRTG